MITENPRLPKLRKGITLLIPTQIGQVNNPLAFTQKVNINEVVI